MQEVRICIVGMGIGRAIGRAITRTTRARVVALCDLFEDRMQMFAEELPGEQKFYTDYREMCRDPEIDAIFVGTPNQYHVPVAIEALLNGKHVLVTKPLADSEEAAQELVTVAESTGLVNMMSLPSRFGIPTQTLGALIQQGDFGELYYARARSIRRQGIPAWNLGFVHKGGGAFRDMGVHVLDAAWWLMGMPEPVSVTGVSGAKFGPKGLGFFGRGAPPEAEYYSQFAADDYTGGFIRFANGSGLQVESFWASHQPEEVQIELFGTEAGARWLPPVVYKSVDGVNLDIPAVELEENWRERSWDAVVGHFVDCIQEGVPCQAPLRHGLIVQQMMEAVLRSAERGTEERFLMPAV
jgi:predicted dehydrogenase